MPPNRARSFLLAAVISLPAPSHLLQAQVTTVSVRGVAFDSLHNRPLVSALVTIVGVKRTVSTDSTGAFRIDEIPVGSQRIIVQHEAIDAIGLSAVGRQIDVASNATAVNIAVPSFATLWRAACGSAAPAADSGFVFGTVRLSAVAGAAADRPAITATWVDVRYDKAAGFARKTWTLETEADSVGNYSLCGVPTSTGLSVRAANDSAETGWIDLPPLDRERIARRDFDLSMRIAALVSLGKGATLHGRIVADSPRTPLANAELSLPELGLAGLSNEKGEVVVSDIMPGSHLVAVRRLGYSPNEQRLEFAVSQTVEHSVYLERITLLDSVKVSARTGPRDEGMREFAERQKRGFGSFVTRADLETRAGQKLSSVAAQLEGIFVLRGRGGQAWVAARRQPKRPSCMSGYTGPASRGTLTGSKMVSCARSAGFYLPDESEAALGMAIACYSTVYLDRVVQNITGEPFDLNSIGVDQVEAFEWYSGVTQIPIEYTRRMSNCGVLVIHTRRDRV